MTARNGQKSGSPSGFNGNPGTIMDSAILGHTSQGVELHASLLRLSRYNAVLEIYDPGLLLQASEVFEDFRVIVHERPVYSGRAVIHNLLDAGVKLICEVRLEEGAWTGAGGHGEPGAQGARGGL